MFSSRFYISFSSIADHEFVVHSLRTMLVPKHSYVHFIILFVSELRQIYTLKRKSILYYPLPKELFTFHRNTLLHMSSRFRSWCSANHTLNTILHHKMAQKV